MPILKDKIQIIYAGMTLILCSVFSYLAIHCYYSDSEIWLLTLSQKVFSPEGPVAIYTKWFFHFVTSISTIWTTQSIWIYNSARITYAIVALLSTILIAQIFSQVYENKKLFFPLMIITLTSSLFFNQAFRIRADILALFLHLVFLSVTCLSHHRWQKTYILILLQVLLILTTPKALIFLALHTALGLFLVNQTGPQKKLGYSILYSIAAPSCLGLFTLSILGLFNPQHAILTSLHGSINFYLKSFDPGLGGAQFFSFFDFMYLFRFFKKSPVHALIFFFWLGVFFRNIFKQNDTLSLVYFFKIYTALLIIFVFLYNQKLPFFLAPFLAPVIAAQFCVFYSFLQKRRLTIMMPFFLFIATLISFRQLSVNLKFNNNFSQKIFISELEEYKKNNPEKTVYDIVGLLPKNTTHYLFVGPGDISQRDQIIAQIKSNLPDIYLFTFKNMFLGNEIYKTLKEFYFEYSPGVWLKSKNIQLNKTTHPIKDLFQFHQKNYWLTSTNHANKIFSTIDKKEITDQCVFLNSYKKPSQTEIQWVAIPLTHIEISILLTPPTNFSLNPQNLFMFDTAF